MRNGFRPSTPHPRLPGLSGRFRSLREALKSQLEAERQLAAEAQAECAALKKQKSDAEALAQETNDMVVGKHFTKKWSLGIWK